MAAWCCKNVAMMCLSRKMQPKKARDHPSFKAQTSPEAITPASLKASITAAKLARASVSTTRPPEGTAGAVACCQPDLNTSV